MKGDGYIKKITIKIIGTGLRDVYQSYVKIYDNKNIYYIGKTYNGEIDVCLKENKAYYICAYLNSKTIKNIFYVTNQKKYIFYFNHSIYNPNHTVTFLLRDFYYNIPIMKGEIILGKNN